MILSTVGKNNLDYMNNGRDTTSNVLSPLGSQQSTEDKNPSESGQFFDPQNRWFLHSSLESQSPSSTSQGLSVVQKSSSPTVAA